MEVPEASREQYSNSSKTSLNYSNSTVAFKEVVSALADIMPDDDYRPFYASRYQKLGYNRYMELANKARAGRDPSHLFFWMLKNNEAVRWLTKSNQSGRVSGMITFILSLYQWFETAEVVVAIIFIPACVVLWIVEGTYRAYKQVMEQKHL